MATRKVKVDGMVVEVQIEKPAIELCQWRIEAAVAEFLWTYAEDDLSKINPEKEKELQLKCDELLKLMSEMEP